MKTALLSLHLCQVRLLELCFHVPVMVLHVSAGLICFHLIALLLTPTYIYHINVDLPMPQ
jgi:hypothetical protein